MKVCHFVASTGLGRGDSFVDLINILAQDIEIVLVCPKNSKFLDVVSDKVKVYEYQTGKSRFNLLLLMELRKIFKQVSPDIVHTHFAKATEIFFILNRFMGSLHVATKHNPRKGKIFNKIKNVIAVSQGVADSIGHSRVKIIYNGINPVKVDEHSGNDVFRILAVGRLDKIKAFDVLIKEVANLPFDYTLEIAGEGEERVALDDLICQLNLQDKVKLLGFRLDIPQLLAGADLQVISSLSEGFSLAMVEGIFYSKMLISTNVAGANEILDRQLIVSDYKISAKISDVYNNYQLYKNTFAEIKNTGMKLLDIRFTSKLYIDYYKELLNSNS